MTIDNKVELDRMEGRLTQMGNQLSYTEECYEDLEERVRSAERESLGLRMALERIARTTGRNGHTASRIIKFAQEALEGLPSHEAEQTLETASEKGK